MASPDALMGRLAGHRLVEALEKDRRAGGASLMCRGKIASSLTPTPKMAEKIFRRGWDYLADSVYGPLAAARASPLGARAKTR